MYFLTTITAIGELFRVFPFASCNFPLPRVSHELPSSFSVFCVHPCQFPDTLSADTPVPPVPAALWRNNCAHSATHHHATEDLSKKGRGKPVPHPAAAVLSLHLFKMCFTYHLWWKNLLYLISNETENTHRLLNQINVQNQNIFTIVFI